MHSGTEQVRLLTLADHLEELRRRLAFSLLFLFAGIAIAATQLDLILQWLKRPAQPWLEHFAFFTPTEPLIAYTKVAVLSGLVLAMPFILAQVWGFVKIGLTVRERNLGLLFIGWGSFQFLLGVVIAYVLLLPASLNILLGIGQEELVPIISIDRYLSFVTTLGFWCGIIFELPVVLFLLARVGIVTSEWLRQQRPYAILVLVIVAAIVTPTTDIVSLVFFAIPMVVLYEASIWLTRFTRSH
ncbi:MAG: twin-arginine translocase subunit TatC [Candidatus Omnitrophica bacterium]|nr:twin-arginine translocase subunit TatC [Candidatus Omnitrophota bacterium]MBI3009858.1 twin-arginine translocase subunit TatC [Candidatus Omnitrophota bacterium]